MTTKDNSLTERRYLRVMAVDDALWTLSQVTGFLEETGIPCDACTRPEDAIEQLRRAPEDYGLVFMDINFGAEVAGFEAAKAISEFDTPNPPAVIGMTGIQELYDYENRNTWGMQDIIKKPLFKWLVVNLAREYCSLPTCDSSMRKQA